MRRAARVDGNHREILTACERLGCSVQSLAQVGHGCPDAVIGLQTHVGHLINLLIEIKDGALSPSRRRLTPDEAQWRDDWRGQVCIIETLEDVAQLIHWARTTL